MVPNWSVYREFCNFMRVSSSCYSNLVPQHGIKHPIITGDARSASYAPANFSRRRCWQFKAMEPERAGVISRSRRSPWAVLLHIVKKKINLNTQLQICIHFILLHFIFFFKAWHCQEILSSPRKQASQNKTAVITPFGLIYTKKNQHPCRLSPIPLLLSQALQIPSTHP